MHSSQTSASKGEIGFVIAKHSDGSISFIHKEQVIFEGTLKQAKLWLSDLFSKTKRGGKPLKTYLDELADLRKRGGRKATKADIEDLAKVRKRFYAGWDKNVATCKGKIGKQKIDLQSRSGIQKGTPQNFDNFESIKPENYHYTNGPESIKINHTEQKQIEYLYNKFKNNKNESGKIEIVSDLEICDNCDWIISAFQKDFPNIEVIRVWVRKELTR